MARDFAKRFYKSKQWQKCRNNFINERRMIDGGICQRCLKAPGYIVHHKIHLSPQNIDNPDISLNFNNLEFVCHECHNDEHFGHKMRVKFTIDGKVLPPIEQN